MMLIDELRAEGDRLIRSGQALERQACEVLDGDLESSGTADVMAAAEDQVAEDIAQGLCVSEVMALRGFGSTKIYRIARDRHLTIQRKDKASVALADKIAALANGHRTVREVAAEAGCAMPTVRKWRDKLGLSIPSRRMGG